MEHQTAKSLRAERQSCIPSRQAGTEHSHSTTHSRVCIASCTGHGDTQSTHAATGNTNLLPCSPQQDRMGVHEKVHIHVQSGSLQQPYPDIHSAQ